MTNPLKKLLLLPDFRGWAYDRAAQGLKKHLANDFDIQIHYINENPEINPESYDLMYVFFWADKYQDRFEKNPLKVVKEISSHRWNNEEIYGYLQPDQMVSNYLRDAKTITATSKRLVDIFSPYEQIWFTPNGYDPEIYRNKDKRTGSIKIGWAGNLNDPCKGIKEILLPAAGKEFEIKIAGGNLTEVEMVEFYNSIDIFCVASTAEGEPLTLIEAMACGCYPICVDVGIVPELIKNGVNGQIIPRSIWMFREAFRWANENKNLIRNLEEKNAEEMLEKRTWEKVVPYWKDVLENALDRLEEFKEDQLESDNITENIIYNNNLGNNNHLSEWPDRAKSAAELIIELNLPKGSTILDMGCGKQTLRPIIEPNLTYIPLDRIKRSPDTIIMDLNIEKPKGFYQVILILGLLEYLDDPRELMFWASTHSVYLVFSYNSDPDLNRRKGLYWENNFSLIELKNYIVEIGGKPLKIKGSGNGLNLFSVQFKNKPQNVSVITGEKTKKTVSNRVGLLSAGLTSTNSGDSLITEATTRLISNVSFEEFPLLKELTDGEIEKLNDCQCAIICGTNLYQHIFNCALSPEIISKIKIPILPLGIGSSAPIGKLPNMDESGKRAIRMLHDQCAIGSARDPISYEFVKSLGIKNVELTGCPVLFHSGRIPEFENYVPNHFHLSIRTRLLHINDGWLQKEIKTLDFLCRKLKPTLVLQSPFDSSIAEKLAREYGVNVEWWVDNSCQSLVKAALNTSRSIGFRLHFAMLCLSYGKYTHLIGSDTRVSEFCKMVDIPYYDVKYYRDDNLLNDIVSPSPDMSSFLRRWNELKVSMVSTLKANGLDTNLENGEEEKPIHLNPLELSQASLTQPRIKKPQILLVTEKPGSLLTCEAQKLLDKLSPYFHFTIIYQGDIYSEKDFDLIYGLEWNLVSLNSEQARVSMDSQWTSEKKILNNAKILWDALDSQFAQSITDSSAVLKECESSIFVKGSTLPKFTVKNEGISQTFHAQKLSIIEAIELINRVPAQMVISERLALFSLVYGTRPRVCLNIAPAQGGTSMIICTALDAVGDGKLISIDPETTIKSEKLERVSYRETLFKGSSPDQAKPAFQTAGEPFDLVLIDGNHSYKDVYNDTQGVLPYLKEGAYLLYHDAFFYDVRDAIGDVLDHFPLIDCGFISMLQNPTQEFFQGRQIIWGGLRMLRFVLS